MTAKKKIVLIVAAVFLCVLLVPAALSLLLNLPEVQTFAVHRAIEEVNKRIHGKIALERIGIALPNTINLDGLLVADTSNDTLLSASRVRVRVDLLGLIFGKVHLRWAGLTDCNAVVKRGATDSLFTFQQLLPAGAPQLGSNPGKKTDNGKFSFDMKGLRLKNVRFLFDDWKSGVRVEARVGLLALFLDKVALENLQFDVNSLALDSAYCSVRLFRKNPPSKGGGPPATLPRITVKTLSATNARFVFEDSVDPLTVRVRAGRINVGKGAVDVGGQTVSAGSVFVRDAGVGLALRTAQTPAAAVRPMRKAGPDHRWRVSAGNIDLAESQCNLDMINMPCRDIGFDPAHLHLYGIKVLAKNAYYAVRTVRGRVSEAMVQDSGGAALRNLAVDFLMDDKGMSAQGLSLKTSSSEIRGSCRTGFSPFAQKMGFSPNMPVYAELGPSTISTAEAGHYLPALAGVPPFKGADKTLRFSGKISGKLASIKAERLWATYGASTELRADGHIDGLPDMKKMALDVPALTLKTGSKDLESLFGKGFLPPSVTLPGQVRLNAAFKGSMRAFLSTVRCESDDGTLAGRATLDSSGRYNGTLTAGDLNPGLLFRKARMVGPITLAATFDGRGFDVKTLSAAVHVDASSVRLKEHTFHDCKLDGRVDSLRCRGTFSVLDEKLSLGGSAEVDAVRGRERARCALDVRKADFARLRLLKDSLVVSGRLEADLKGRDMNTLSGSLSLCDAALTKSGSTVRLDSLAGIITSGPEGQNFSIHSAMLEAQYHGSLPAAGALNMLEKRIWRSLPSLPGAPDSALVPAAGDFYLVVNVYDHPLLSGFLLPKLTACEGAVIGVTYSGKSDKLLIDAAVPYGAYGGAEFSGVHATVNASGSGLTYAVAADDISAGGTDVTGVKAWGASTRERASFTLSSVGNKQDTALYAALSMAASDSGLVLALDPRRFYLGGSPWTVRPGNYVVVRKGGIAVHDLSLSSNTSSITVSSRPESGAFSVGIRDFALKSLSKMLRQDSTFVGGMLNADIVMNGRNEQSGLDAKADLRDIVVRKVKVGSLSLAASDAGGKTYRVSAGLSGQGNDVSISGTIGLAEARPKIDLHADIASLAVQSVEPFTRDAIAESRGALTGTITCTGMLPRPLLNGQVVFRDVSVKPSAINSVIRLGGEPIEIRNSTFHFNDFSLGDQQKHSARLSGAVAMDSAGRFQFNVRADAADFLLLNTTARNNPVIYGRVIVDWQATIRGTQQLPVIDARVVLKAPTHLTLAVPGQGSNTDRGQNVVVFSGAAPAGTVDKHLKVRQKDVDKFRGIAFAAEIEADRGTTLRLIPDPSMRDSLVVRGDAALNFGMDKSGHLSLTGTYDFSEGSYTVTLPPLLTKKFIISPGSTLLWRGNLTDATTAITAQYEVSAAPIDLVENLITGMSEEQRNAYRMPLQFEITLNLNGPLLKPDLSFAINLAPSDKGALSGLVDARLSQINADPTSLNKQVFALLVLGKFLPETINQATGTSGLATAAMSSVSSFLTAQVNQWGGSILPGVQLNIGLQSYDQYDSGQGQTVGNTQVDLGVKKDLFNNRLSVEAGGAIGVQGTKTNQNDAKDFGGNVSVEYKLTRDGGYRLKGYRRTQTESALDVPVTETGVGVVYSRSFNFWRQLFSRQKKDAKKNE